MFPIRNISYLLPMCCSFWKQCINSQKTGLGCSTPLISEFKSPKPTDTCQNESFKYNIEVAALQGKLMYKII